MIQKPRVWVFSVKETHQMVEHSMSKHLGVGAFSNNYMNIISLALESVLVDFVDSGPYSHIEILKRELKDYGLDDDQVEDVYPSLLSTVSRMARLVRSQYRLGPDEAFVTIQGDYGDINVTVIKEGYSPKEDLEYLQPDKVIRDIEDGHHVPAKFRKLHGLG